MVVFAGPPPRPEDDSLAEEAFTHGTPSANDPMVSRAWRQREHPGPCDDQAWVVHSEAAWSATHLEESPATVAALVADALRARLQTEAPLLHAVAHRWRYARVEHGLHDPCLFDDTQGIGACGDWGSAGAPQRSHQSVERAWLSGIALAGRVLARITSQSHPAL
jgi:predicted NAD/FAD-dependent oxidoreductase